MRLLSGGSLVEHVGGVGAEHQIVSQDRFHDGERVGVGQNRPEDGAFLRQIPNPLLRGFDLVAVKMRGAVRFINGERVDQLARFGDLLFIEIAFKQQVTLAVAKFLNRLFDIHV